jgi:hypothetical protein
MTNNVVMFQPRPKKPDPICSICHREYDGFGNNPYPVGDFDDGACCNDCNTRAVLPARGRSSTTA